jgi:hypothetical protein
MSAPKGTGRSVEIRLSGYVTLQEVCAQVAEIWRQARQEQGLLFTLNCSGVVDFSTLALTALARLQKHLREFGCDLLLVQCSALLLERKQDPLLAPLLSLHGSTAPPTPPTSVPGANRLRQRDVQTHLPHEQEPPHYFHQLVRSYQRFWLN